MQIHFWKRMRGFFRTTFIGGLVALLPISMVIILFRWIINLIERHLGPVIDLVTDTDSRLYTFGLYLAAIIIIFLVFFTIGLIIKTRWGKFLNKQLEKKYLVKIPGYKIARDTVAQFFGKNKSFFKEVVIVDLFNTGTLMTGFITDDSGEIVTVFVPTGPNPTSGNIYHLPKEKVLRTNAPVDLGMKTIISCGAGSSEVFANIQPEEGTT
ncbi:MAG: DUF502 domain-containing protein [Bacteroidales bacterium]|nr:DUF502 domain-containing protein [Bacteroidales bacterium]MDT8431204.1 DUF502 domain-containing protein [Bacteroidales bacterium]